MARKLPSSTWRENPGHRRHRVHGGHLARFLAKRGHEVRGLARPAGPEPRSCPPRGIDVAYGDLTDPPSLAPACAGVDVAHHVAATFRTAGQPDEAYRAVNAGGTRALPDAARAAGVRRFAHCSTGGVHGRVERPPADEDAPFAPGDAFDTSRARRELACDPAVDLPEGIRRTAAWYRERGRL